MRARPPATVVNLVRFLPHDSAYARSHNPEWWWWQPEHELLAMSIESAHANALNLLGAWLGKGADLPDPIRLPRPPRVEQPEPSPKEAVVAFFRR